MILDITVPTGRKHRPKQQKGTQWHTVLNRITLNLRNSFLTTLLLTVKINAALLVAELDFNVLLISI